jgi:hypothetical protein
VQTEGVHQEKGAENIWTKDTGINRRLEKTA